MTDTLNILLVEDSPSDAKLVVGQLKRKWPNVHTVRVETAAAMRAALAEGRWDAVVSDWSLPTFNGLEALAVLQGSAVEVPFIIASGTIGEETAVEAMRAGAHDFVLKDALERLTPALERAMRECRERIARRQVEQALRDSEARFRRLSESGIIGITTTDIRGQISDANDTFLDMIGYSRAELEQGLLRWTDLTPPEFAHLGAEAAAQLEESGVAPPWETESLRKDGSRVPVLVGVAMLDYPQCIAFVADLTARRAVEANLAEAEAALRRSEEQLRHAQKMEAVGRLAGGVAHDFNNVLSVILSYASLLLDDLPVDDAKREDVAEIHSAAKRAARLTEQLLLVSRHQVVEPKIIDLHELLTGMDSMLRRILGEDVALTLVPPREPGRVLANPSYLEQVVLNLVVNARDAMPMGGKLTIETANVVLDEHYVASHLPAKVGPHVLLAVTDTGVGMNRATQRQIFEPFFTTKATGKGTGLGLSTVFGIVNQSGGHIWLYSEPGHGSTFKIYLPRVDSEVSDTTPPLAPRSLRGTELILVVEDEDQVRAVVQNVLERQGYHVLVAATGDEALRLCRDTPIDLLLTDVVMPQMSGPDLAAAVLAAHPRVKVLFMSGYTDDSIVRHGVLASGAAFVQKPLTPVALATRVRAVLDGPPPQERPV